MLQQFEGWQSLNALPPSLPTYLVVFWSEVIHEVSLQLWQCHSQASPELLGWFRLLRVDVRWC